MTCETIRGLLEPLIGKAGAIPWLSAGPVPPGSSQPRTRSWPAWWFARMAWCAWSARPDGPWST